MWIRRSTWKHHQFLLKRACENRAVAEDERDLAIARAEELEIKVAELKAEINKLRKENSNDGLS